LYSLKVASYVSSNLEIVLAEIVGFNGLEVTVDLLLLLLTENLGMWADFLGIKNLN